MTYGQSRTSLSCMEPKARLASPSHQTCAPVRQLRPTYCSVVPHDTGDRWPEQHLAMPAAVAETAVMVEEEELVAATVAVSAVVK